PCHARSSLVLLLAAFIISQLPRPPRPPPFPYTTLSRSVPTLLRGPVASRRAGRCFPHGRAPPPGRFRAHPGSRIAPAASARLAQGAVRTAHVCANPRQAR